MKYYAANQFTPCNGWFYHCTNDGVAPCKDIETALAAHRAIRVNNQYTFSKVLYFDMQGNQYEIVS